MKVALLILALVQISLCWAAAEISIEDNSTWIVVNNGAVQLELEKRRGFIRKLIFEGRNMLAYLGGYTGMRYNDPKTGRSIEWYLGSAGNAHFTVAKSSDGTWARISISLAAKSQIGSVRLPFHWRQNYILRQGEPGFHSYTEVSYEDKPSFLLEQASVLQLRVAPEIFTHFRAVDGRTAPLPTVSEMKNGTDVMDATVWLPEGSDYERATGRRAYTKYDWWISENLAHYARGFYGNGYGVWMVNPHGRETQNGGPFRIVGNVHQTKRTPHMMTANGQHAGVGMTPVTQGWKKYYGPIYVHFNRGDADAVIADADHYLDSATHQKFYDQLKLPGYAGSTERVVVKGAVRVEGRELPFEKQSPSRAIVFLGDNKRNHHKTGIGYRYWGFIDEEGNYEIPRVRPGTYRLTVLIPGEYGQYSQDNFVVKSSSAIQRADIHWQPSRPGQLVWQIGTPDYSSGEFHNGANKELHWGDHFTFYDEFPSGVNFVIGKSSERQDWNYTQWALPGWGRHTPFRIHFSGDRISPNTKSLTLRTQVIAWRDDEDRNRVAVRLNGTTVGYLVRSREELDGSVVRSRNTGHMTLHDLKFDAKQILPGENTLEFEMVLNDQELEIQNSGGAQKVEWGYDLSHHSGLQYDAIGLFEE